MLMPWEDWRRTTGVIGATVAAGALFVAAGMLMATKAHGAEVRSRSGKHAHVSAAAQPRLQCVVDFIEARGIRITAMRGYGRGTVRGSLHPSGQALDINQIGRDRTRPHIPVMIANAAGVQCNVISGGTWRARDSGHWNLAGHRHTRTRYANRRRHAI